MRRLRHTRTGVVVNVSDGRAHRLRPAFVPAVPAGPNQTATKAEWVDHAVASGADRSDAEAMTKAELQERFG